MKAILLFSVGSWLVLHGVVSVETGRGMFTGVRSQGPEIAVTSSIFKVRFGVLLLNLWPLYQTLAMYLRRLNRTEKTRHLKTCILFRPWSYDDCTHCINSRFSNYNLNFNVRANLLSLFTDSVSIPDVKNNNNNMCLGLTLTRMSAVNGLMVFVFVCAFTWKIKRKSYNCRDWQIFSLLFNLKWYTLLLLSLCLLINLLILQWNIHHFDTCLVNTAFKCCPKYCNHKMDTLGQHSSMPWKG